MSTLICMFVMAQNYQAYPLGPRTSGMGGAATALGSGAGNTFYNPAALAFSTLSNLEVAGNIFGLDGTSLSGEIGDATSHTNVSFFVIPSNLSIETHGLDLGPIHMSDRWGFGVSVVAPLNFSVSSTVASKNGATAVYRDAKETTYTIYNDLSYRLSDEVGLGVSIVAMYRNAETTSIAERDGSDSYQSLTYLRTEHTLGHTLAFGGQWRPTNGLRIGVAMRLPLQNVAGFGRERSRTTTHDKSAGTLGLEIVDHTLDLKFELPYRIGLGVAYEREKRFAIAADLFVFTPYSYLAARDTDTGETLLTKHLQPVVNFAVGAELWLGSRPLRFGLFTDFSPSGPVSVDGASQRIDRWGATIGTNVQRAVFHTDIGLAFTIGRLETLGIDLSHGTFAPVVAQGLQWRGMITYASVLQY